MSACYLGVDAGNSKTVALVADADGRILGRGRGGVGDIYGAASEDEAVSAVLAAAHGALTEAGCAPEEVTRAAFRLAGVAWPEDEAFWEQALAARLGGVHRERVSIKNDGFALLRCGRTSGVGVAITAGSGPAVAARGGDGREYCASWWIQHDLAGNGLGLAAFRAVVDADLGLGLPTALTEGLLQLYGYPDVTAMLYAFTRRAATRLVPHLRTAARTVLRVAEAGDQVAAGIVTQQTHLLARLARVAAERTGLVPSDAAATSDPGTLPVVLGGSVLTSEHPVYRDALIRALEQEVGRVELASWAASPVAGALLDALAEGGIPIGTSLQHRVLEAVHPADFLLT